MALSDDYHAGVGDWRAQLRRNEPKTRLVMAVFILIYLVVGLIIDVLMLQSIHAGTSAADCLWGLLHGYAIPYATLTMGGLALISLAVTYAMYDRIMLLGTDYYEITLQNARNIQEKQLYDVVEEMKVAAALKYMPRVFLLEAPFMNAFASGYSEKSAMVVMTRGLMEKLTRAELQAVMAHELSHIRHHDVKLTLMVAVLSNILLMVVDTLFYSVVFNRDDERQDNKLVFIAILLRYLVPLLTIVLALFLSRTREYMADAGAVELMRDNAPLASALLKITEDHDVHAEAYAKAYGQTPHEQVRQASYLFDPSDIDPVKSLHNAFSTHPQIKDRLLALGFKSKK